MGGFPVAEDLGFCCFWVEPCDLTAGCFRPCFWLFTWDPGLACRVLGRFFLLRCVSLGEVRGSAVALDLVERYVACELCCFEADLGLLQVTRSGSRPRLP